MPQTPLAIFVYNRPEHTRELFDSLKDCARIQECPIFVFCDGPQKPSHQPQVEAVRQLSEAFASSFGGKVICSEENLGLSRSLISGITQVCNQYGRVIVLEDDLVLHPRALDFMIQSLDYYEKDENVSHISAFLFPIKSHSPTDALLFPMFNSWGWATWARAWQAYEWEPEKAVHELTTDKDLKKWLDMEGASPYYDMILHHYQSGDMVWDLLWHWKIASRRQLGVFPRRSLIWCTGFDGSGTHIPSVPDGYQAGYEQVMSAALGEKISFPPTIKVYPRAYRALKRFLEEKYSRMPFYRRFVKLALRKIWRIVTAK